VLAKRFRASLEQRAWIEARRLVGLIRARLEREGIRSHVAKRYSRGGWMAKYPFRVWPDDTQVARAWLRDAGLSEAEIRAVVRGGLSAEELNELFLRGIQAASTSSAASRGS
jgi:hypothetical protein